MLRQAAAKGEFALTEPSLEVVNAKSICRGRFCSISVTKECARCGQESSTLPSKPKWSNVPVRLYETVRGRLATRGQNSIDTKSRATTTDGTSGEALQIVERRVLAPHA
jgi:hypothetical protein